MAHLRSKGTGTLLVYSAEVHEQDGVSSSHIPPYKENIIEVTRVIDAAAEFEGSMRHVEDAKGGGKGKTWCAVKLTALLPDAESIERLSRYLAMKEEKQTSKGWGLTRLFGGFKSSRVPYPHTPTLNGLESIIDASSKADLLSPLTHEDIDSIRELHENLRGLCIRAKEKGVTVVFDSEHTW